MTRLYYKLEENYISLEIQSQAITPVTPSEPEGRKGKGKRHRKITVINPVVTSKGKFPKAADNKSVEGTVKVHLRDLGFQRHQPEDREGLSRTRRPGRGHLGHSGGWKDIEGNIPTLPFTFKFNRNLKPEDWKDMDQVLQLHQLFKDLFQWNMDNKRFDLASHWEELGASCQKICLKGIEFRNLMVINKGCNPTRQLRVLEIPSGSQGVDQNSSPVDSHHSGTNRSVVKSHHSSQSQEVSRRRQGYKVKKDHLHPKEQRVRPNDSKAVGFGERSAQEPEVAVNYSRISFPINRSISPTQIKHNVVTPESNLNSDALWLQMSQYAAQTQKQFAELEASHERRKKLISSLDKIVETFKKDILN
ncbi:hypothetical protein O181_038016 [Austropuccinia psidii MF-1]|uniref:Uncharacterized protein n=1 Tax=Austropuccinia psidii MF-1 TaxID=1389203 RepID=A0A9Q3D794_9BASI|nr:hypothetical protein [Austropuccinia psidii MF-1]